MAKTPKEEEKKKFYVTTPIYYPNDIPHLGHAYTSIACDVLARFHRSLGHDVLFTTGTDDHGQKIEETAKEKGKDVKKFLDELIPRFKDAWKKLNISYDDFIRTIEERHKKAVVEIINRVNKAGDIYEGEYEGLYCVGCEAFYLEKDLIDGCCPIHKKKAKPLKEESYFFKLSEYQHKLLKFYEENPEFLSPRHRAPETISRVKEGLKDLSITRTSFSWGIPFPLDEKHVTYVWFDALTNYLTCAGFPDDKKKFEKFWPADVHIVGKDIMWFHNVIWPAMLMSAKLPLPKKVYAHGWWTFDGEKMSKSLGNVIEPIKTAEKYGTDELRYFLLREAPFGEDGDFSEKMLMQHINSELADDLGNLLSRATVMVQKNFDGIIPAKSKEKNKKNEKNTEDAKHENARHEKSDDDLFKESQIFNNVKKYMDLLEFNNALAEIWKFIRAANKYVNETEPWKISDKERLADVVYNICESLRVISIYIEPFMPTKATEIRTQLGIEKQNFESLKEHLKSGIKIAKGNHLFKKWDLAEFEKQEKEKAAKEKEAKKQSMPADFSILNLKVAKIISCKNHPDADKLFVMEIDLGGENKEKRPLVAGLRQHYAAEDLVEKHIVVVTNLKPAKLRGFESRGMLLAADDGSHVKILEAKKSQPGEQVFVEGFSTNKDEIEYADFAKIELSVKDKTATYSEKPLQTKHEKIHCEIADYSRIR